MPGLINVDVKGIAEAVGGLATQIRSAITGDISPTAKAALESAALAADQARDLAQAAINQAEATGGWFRSGWRPFIGWTCGIAICYNFLVAPLGTRLLGGAWPKVDMAELWPLVLGMLGLGTMRTVEKIGSK